MYGLYILHNRDFLNTEVVVGRRRRKRRGRVIRRERRMRRRRVRKSQPALCGRYRTRRRCRGGGRSEDEERA